MTFEEIRDLIATAMHHHPNWGNILDDTTPGHYGLDDVEFEVALTDIWVDIQKRSFTFRNGTLSFSARMLASNEHDGVDMNFKKVVSGFGSFEFRGSTLIEVPSFQVNERIDLLD